MSLVKEIFDDVFLLILLQQPGRRSGLDRFSSWSTWSTCSRTCDGGVSYQLRRCRSNTGCYGETIRYKICNMQVSWIAALRLAFKPSSLFSRWLFAFRHALWKKNSFLIPSKLLSLLKNSANERFQLNWISAIDYHYFKIKKVQFPI